MADLKTLRDLIDGHSFEVTLTSKVLNKLLKRTSEPIDYDITFTFDKRYNVTNIFKYYSVGGMFSWDEKKEILWDRADHNEIEDWCTIIKYVKGILDVQ